jgi:hypothetical protein
MGTHEWMFEWFGDDSGEWSLRALDEASTRWVAIREPGVSAGAPGQARWSYPLPIRPAEPPPRFAPAAA